MNTIRYRNYCQSNPRTYNEYGYRITITKIAN